MRAEGRTASTLLLASMSLPSARQLAAVAQKRPWPVYALDETPDVTVMGRRTFYGGSDRAAEYASRYDLCLIEPPLDLLARVPPDLLSRDVRYGSLAALSGVAGPVFVKPADPVLKSFDAGVYRAVSEVRGRRPIAGDTPVLVAEPVEWTSEFRCFVRDGRVEAWSPYLSFGRPVWKPGGAGAMPPSLVAFCERLNDRMRAALPPAFVVDVGVLEDGRWAVVEFNPAWCSGILGADVEGVLRVLERAASSMAFAGPNDQAWARLGSPAAAARRSG
jgi:hypothetical protein